MTSKEEDQLHQKTDAKVHLSNQRITAKFCHGEVNTCRQRSGQEVLKAGQETIAYFVPEFETMMEENFDNYIKNLDSHKIATAVHTINKA